MLECWNQMIFRPILSTFEDFWKTYEIFSQKLIFFYYLLNIDNDSKQLLLNTFFDIFNIGGATLLFICRSGLDLFS